MGINPDDIIYDIIGQILRHLKLDTDILRVLGLFLAACHTPGLAHGNGLSINQAHEDMPVSNQGESSERSIKKNGQKAKL